MELWVYLRPIVVTKDFSRKNHYNIYFSENGKKDVTVVVNKGIRQSVK